VQNENEMSDLFARLEAENAGYTAAERQIALFLLNNREMIPFETAASIAQRLDVSAVTVGRFCRMLGFKHFRELKEHLRMSAHLPWLAGQAFQDFLSDFTDNDKRRRTLEREIELLVAVYERSQHKAWSDTVALIARSKRVQIVGFQTERGIAAMLAHNLQYVRPGVELIDSASGHFADVLLEHPGDRCLVIVDVRRYSRTSRHLAERAAEVGIPLVIITDTLCDWAPRLTSNVLAADSDGALFWQSSVPMMGLVNLLVNDIVGHGGGRDVEERLERISALYEDFIGFVRPTRMRGGDA
jgi:DNA-binding MurR/RpiR family transcriptional regulator